MDRFLAPLVAGRWWYLRVAAAAIVLSLLYNTPGRSLWTHSGWAREVFEQQAAHPLTPLDLARYDTDAAASDIGTISHLDKIAFRLTIPVLGKILGTGAHSWLIFCALAGVAFYPLFATVAERWLGSRLIAMYLTLALAVTWAGSHFFNDNTYGDGVALFFLLLSVATRSPWIVFLSVLLAGFTDERGLMASIGTFFFWVFREETTRKRTSPLSWLGGKEGIAVLVAWFLYGATRWYLGWKFGLKTGSSMMGADILVAHLSDGIPYKIVPIFEGLWLWLLLGFLALVVRRCYAAAGAFVGTWLLLLGTSLIVWDLDRSLAYALVLFPWAWRAGGLQPGNTLLAARLVFLLGLILVTPWNTPLHFLHLGQP